MTVSQSIARFVHALDLDRVPSEVAEKTRVCLLNGYGIAMGCHDTPFAPVARCAAIARAGTSRPAPRFSATDARRVSPPPASPIQPCFTGAGRKTPVAPRTWARS